MPEKFRPENGGEQPKPPSKIEGEPVGETWGEKKERIILDKAKELGAAGLPVADVLSILQKSVYAAERAAGGDPEKVDGVVDSDDVSFTLIDLKKEGLIEIREGKIYLLEKK